MKLFVISLAILLVTSIGFARDTYVHGYTKSNGTYVSPHYRTAPDSTINNNWSTKGNVNPYTGKEGTREPDYGTRVNDSSIDD